MAGSRNSRSPDILSAAVADCFRRHVAANDKVALGLSGGLDSVVLLHAVRSTHEMLSAVHVNHGLNARADQWANFCVSLCAEWDVPLTIERIEVERDSPDGLEAAARRARHDVYIRSGADWIVLAHHRSDRAETVLLNILRGAGVRGAGAMRERNGRLLRPLLQVGRAEILAHALGHGLKWVEDDSNTDVSHSRNFLRHCVIPEIQGRYPAAERRLASAATRFAEACDLLDDLARQDIGFPGGGFPVAVECLAKLTEPRARNVLRFLLSELGVGIPSEERLREALRQCLMARPDRHPSIVFGRWVLRRRGHLITLESP